jgi:hypothetical protein
LDLKLISLGEDHSHQPKWPKIEDEQRDDGVGYPIRFLFEEALAQHRNKMMENFIHILRQFPMETEIPSTRNHFIGATHFKVQFKFDIPLFEGKIDEDPLEKWLNLLEGYYYVQKNLNIEKITFTLFKALLHVKYWWEIYLEFYDKDESTTLRTKPNWETFVDNLKEELYHVGNYDDKYTRWTTLRRERDQTML